MNHISNNLVPTSVLCTLPLLQKNNNTLPTCFIHCDPIYRITTPLQLLSVLSIVPPLHNNNTPAVSTWPVHFFFFAIFIAYLLYPLWPHYRIIIQLLCLHVLSILPTLQNYNMPVPTCPCPFCHHDRITIRLCRPVLAHSATIKE